MELQSLIVCGKLFHSLGAAAQKALSPYILLSVLGTISKFLLAERSARGGLY